MALDADAQAVVAMRAQALPGGLHGVPIEEARALSDAMAKMAPAGPDVARVENREVPVESGSSVPVRIYWPTEEPNLPALMWFHGGAFALGSLDGADATCRQLAQGARVVVVSVDYRLAPEHKFPSGVEDCFAATSWVVANAGELSVDAARVAVGGDSAGATMAAAVCLMARDRGASALAFQLLAYPTTQMRISSYEYVDAPIVGAAMTAHFWTSYVRSDADLANPYCAPLTASSLEGLPPAFVLVPEVDSTRADQELYAQRLASAGVLTTYKVYPGTPHGFFTMTASLEKGREAMADALTVLSSRLHRN